MTTGQIVLLILVVGFPVWAIVATIAAFKQKSGRVKATEQLRLLEERFRPILNEEAEVARLKEVANTTTREIADLRASYAEKKSVFDRLAKEVAIFDEKFAFAEMGVYEPHFDFTDSEQYKTAILSNRDAQKRLVSNKTAAVCRTEWTVGGSKAKGQTMTNRNIKLTLRAFNNECDAAVANIRWNNANAMESEFSPHDSRSTISTRRLKFTSPTST